MREISIDIETYSPVNLITCGTYKYVEHDDHQVLWLAYEWLGEGPDEGVTKKIDVYRDGIPGWMKAVLKDPLFLKRAWNANFEITNLSKAIGVDLDPAQWMCTMVLSANAGYPMALEMAAQTMGVDAQKDKRGKALIDMFCKPQTPTKANGGRTRIYPDDEPEAWAEFGEYCAQDVRAERDALAFIRNIPFTEFDRRLWILDQKINKLGVRISTKLATQAVQISEKRKAAIKKQAQDITGLDNPNSRAQLLDWLWDNGVELEDLKKGTVEEVYKQLKDGDVKEALRLKTQLGRNSITKYKKALGAVCSDGRVRGMTQFKGAGRTGRWCLAENSQVLVKNEHGIYEKSIQDILVTDLVFDGDNWVEHEGVVFSGDKDVIEWDGVCATEEHIVYLDSDTRLTLKQAKEAKKLLWRGNTQFTSSQVPPVNLT